MQSNSGDIYFKNCDFDNLKIDSDMGDIHFVGTEDVMGAWNIQIDTDMGDIDVDDALGGKVEGRTRMIVICLIHRKERVATW